MRGQWVVTLDTFVVSTGKSTVTFTRLQAPFVNRDGFRAALGASLGRGAQVVAAPPAFAHPRTRPKAAFCYHQPGTLNRRKQGGHQGGDRKWQGVLPILRTLSSPSAGRLCGRPARHE